MTSPYTRGSMIMGTSSTGLSIMSHMVSRFKKKQKRKIRVQKKLNRIFK